MKKTSNCISSFAIHKIQKIWFATEFFFFFFNVSQLCARLQHIFFFPKGSRSHFGNEKPKKTLVPSRERLIIDEGLRSTEGRNSFNPP